MNAAEVLAQHTMTRWRSFSNDNEILRCTTCKRDFGRLTGKPRRTDLNPHDEWNAHLLDALKAAGFAVVELPEQVDERWLVDEKDDDLSVWLTDLAYNESGKLAGKGCQIFWGTVALTFWPGQARAIAAALLAAADAAETNS